MDRVKFYSEYDMACEWELDKIIERINDHSIEKEWSLEDVIEFFNILKYMEVERFAEYIQEKTNVICIDYIKEIKAKIGKFIGFNKSVIISKYDDINFLQMNMKDIILDKKYDGIMLAYSLFHLTKQEVLEVLPKYYSLLNNNGKMLLILQSGKGEQVIDEPLKNGLKMFINYYSLEEIREVLEDNNFKILYTDLKKPESEFELGNEKIIIICERITTVKTKEIC